MPKKSIRLIVFGIVLLTFSLAVILLVSLNFGFLNKKSSPIPPVNIVKQVAKYPQNIEDTKIRLNNESSKYKNDPMGLTLFSIGFGLQDFDYFANWDFSKTPFFASVEGVSKDSSTITVKMVGPDSMPFISETKVLDVTGCSSTNSFVAPRLENGNLGEVLFGNVNILDQVKVGDDFVAMCMDDTCTKVGRMCKVYSSYNK